MSLLFFPSRRLGAWVLLAALGSGGAVVAAAATAADPAEAGFLAENDAAMNKMMDGMAPHPTGDVDHDFVEMMIAHHQGAIDMAQAQLRYGKNETLRRISQEIIVEQLQEISAMRLALGQPLPASVASPDQTDPLASPNHHSMHAN
jgi:hypothetical protein